MTGWKITSSVDSVELNRNGTGELTFTISNPGPDDDEAMFDVVPSGGADPSWFSVEDPKRLILPGWSAEYHVRIAVPSKVKSGSFALQGRVYTEGTSPSETGVVTGRVGLRLAPGQGGGPGSGQGSGRAGQSGGQSGSRGGGGRAGGDRTSDRAGGSDVEAEQRKGSFLSGRKWLIPVGAVALVLIVLVGWLAVRSSDVVVPDLAGKKLADAQKSLTVADLAVGVVRKRHDPDLDIGDVRAQSPKAGAKVKPGAKVNLEVAIQLDGPTLMAPANNAVVKGATFPHLTWEPVPDATGYRVKVDREWCLSVLGGKGTCSWVTDRVDIKGTTSARPTLKKIEGESLFSGRVRWQLSALDDFGKPGSPSQIYLFQLKK